MLKLYKRQIMLVNYDPQRRCYNGAFKDARLEWGPWEYFCKVKKEKAEESLKFWEDLNKYAVDARGQSAKCEYKIKE